MLTVRKLEDDLETLSTKNVTAELWEQRVEDLGLGAKLEVLKAEVRSGPEGAKEHEFLRDYIRVLESFEDHPDPLAALEEMLDKIDG